MDDQFSPGKHIKNLKTGPKVGLVDSNEVPLEGILGVAGAVETIDAAVNIGADRLIMQPGSEFELHTHPGAHILYVLSSRGFIHVDGVDYEMGDGDTVYVPANYAHGVKTDPTVSKPLEIVAFGVPHMPLESSDRMELVGREGAHDELDVLDAPG
ncbi:cupin domain-containing protein [Saccharopolyspora sp. SCSIO 74807]|uniref:cupin domain-containing protein n=1 Tax=Saccharopolyspora sp. SCSIO 74807 TaxID=3118084 RepID=UPI0030CE178B